MRTSFLICAIRLQDAVPAPSLLPQAACFCYRRRFAAFAFPILDDGRKVVYREFTWT